MGTTKNLEQRRAIEQLIEEMEQRWPSPVVARKDIGRYTGGLISPKTAANLDSLGLGCPGKFCIGNNAGYPTSSMSIWLKSRIK